MATLPSSIAVTEGSGKNLDTAQLTTSAGVVEREGVFIGDAETAGNRATVDENGSLHVSLQDLSRAIQIALLAALNRQIANESSSGRLRVVLDPLGGAQTLGTVTTVTTVTTAATVTNVSNLVAMGPASAGIPIRDALLTPTDRTNWANNVRARIT